MSKTKKISNMESNKKKKVKSNIEPINKSKTTVAAKISTLIEYGRKEICTREELEKFPIGSLISYINKNDIFKSCGFITKFGDDYFIYVTPDFKNKYRARYKNIKKMWVGDVFDVEKDIVGLREPSKKTNFKATVGNHVVHYARDNFALKKFINTDKYKRMLEWYQYFYEK